jgi:hypothetical protein
LEMRSSSDAIATDVKPNGAAISALCGLTGKKPAVAEGFPTTGAVFDPLSLEPISAMRSMLSGKLAVKYRTADVEIALSPDELLRLLARDLWPDEYFGLRKHFGEFHEIHSDFYDPKTGAAVQPVTRKR